MYLTNVVSSSPTRLTIDRSSTLLPTNSTCTPTCFRYLVATGGARLFLGIAVDSAFWHRTPGRVESEVVGANQLSNKQSARHEKITPSTTPTTLIVHKSMPAYTTRCSERPREDDERVQEYAIEHDVAMERVNHHLPKP